MLSAPLSADERGRLAALHRYCVLDTPAEPAFDRLTHIAAHVLGVPTVLVSLVDAERQWFKSRVGLDALETPRDISFCGHAVYLREALVVPDATRDARFADNPLVAGPLGLRFYAGMPLMTADGHALGTLCAIDYVARPAPTAQQLGMLSMLADAVVAALELRLFGQAEAARARLAQVTGDLSAQAHAATDLEQALPGMLGTLCAYAGATLGHVWRLDPPGSNTYRSSGVWWGDDAAALARWRDGAAAEPPRSCESLLGTVPANGAAIHVADPLALAGARAERARGEGFAFAFGFGFVANGRPQGIVEAHGPILNASRRDLETAADHVAAQLGRLAERERLAQLKDDFVNTVSHELRTPVTSIAGSLELLADGRGGALPARASKMVEVALRNSLRLSRLVNDILDIGKFESGCLSLELEPHPIGALIERAVAETESFAQSFGVRLEFAAGAPAAQALLDADRFIQVLTNLLSNAVKFSPAGEVVRLTLHALGGGWRVSVADRGMGIPEELRSRVFEKFFQAGATLRKTHGTGLGLAIVKRLVEGMGATVRFDTAIGAGTTFHVDLPAWPAATGGGRPGSAAAAG